MLPVLFAGCGYWSFFCPVSITQSNVLFICTGYFFFVSMALLLSFVDLRSFEACCVASAVACVGTGGYCDSDTTCDIPAGVECDV